MIQFGKMKQGSCIDWRVVSYASYQGSLIHLLAQIPVELWSMRSDFRFHETLLHNACRGPNAMAVAVLIQSRMVDVNACDDMMWTAAHLAVAREQHIALEMLCAAGADLRCLDHQLHSPVDHAIGHLPTNNLDIHPIMRVFLANGVRLSTLNKHYVKNITPAMRLFESGILRCRQAVIAMLRLKKAAQLWHMDRFLIREIGFAIWATRYNTIWQK